MDDHSDYQSVNCEPRPGFLVRTMCGYYGILQEKQEDGRWLVFLANGICTLASQQEFWILPLSYDSESPASFNEILILKSKFTSKGRPSDASA